MRKLAMRGLLAAALCASLATTARAAADGDEPMGPPSADWTAMWKSLFGSKNKPEEKSDKPDKKKAEASESPRLPTLAECEAMKRREKDAYFRRLAVCDRLKQLAQEKNDLDLERRVEEVEQDAFNLYQQRTTGLAQSNLDEESPTPKDRKASGARANTPNQSAGEDNK